MMSARPSSSPTVVIVLSKGRVLREIDVTLPRPRSWDALTEDSDFKRLSAEVLQMVRAA